MQAKVEEELIPDQLFVNGKKQISARYPNFDPNIRIFNGYAADACSPERVKTGATPREVICTPCTAENGEATNTASKAKTPRAN